MCLQEQKKQTEIELADLQTSLAGMLRNIEANLINLNPVVRSMYGSMIEFRAEVKNNITSLREDLNVLNDSVSNRSVCLQEHKEQTTTELANHTFKLDRNMKKLATSVFQQKQQMTTELATLQTSLASIDVNFTTQLAQLQTSLNALQTSQANHTCQLKETFNTRLSQHNQKLKAELTLLHTSLNSTYSKLDSLTATNAQLSSDHQQIQANISDVECLDTEQSLELHQNMYDDLTHQLEKIQDDVTTILGPYTCGGTGWRRVVYLDMTDPSTICPSGWKLTGYSKRTCGRATDGTFTCDSATFPVRGGEYKRVCGRIRAYQYASPDAFQRLPYTYVATLNNAYVDGVSVTHGTPRNHIWTFVAGLKEGSPTSTHVCPCDATSNIRIPSFVGEDYFCESGNTEAWIHTFYPNDILWDGEDCLPRSTCCSRRNPPYFVKQLPTSTTDDVEARICLDEVSSNENIAVELVELYVQ